MPSRFTPQRPPLPPEVTDALAPDYTTATDAVLLAGLRDAEPAAWDAFFLRFAPVLLREARRLGAPDAAREDLVYETVGAALERLADPERDPFTGPVLSYLRTALRHRACNHVRGERRREARALAAAEPVADCPGVVAAAVSAYSLGLTVPADRAAADDAGGPEHPVRGLAAVLEAALRPDERLLLGRRAAGATYAETGAAVGVSRGAAEKRILRIRRRLQAAGEAYAATLAPAARREVRRFLRRALDRPAAAAPRTARRPNAAGAVPNVAAAASRP